LAFSGLGGYTFAIHRGKKYLHGNAVRAFSWAIDTEGETC
jgi:hypothetical protein